MFNYCWTFILNKKRRDYNEKQAKQANKVDSSSSIY